jgi:hypothetical protein
MIALPMLVIAGSLIGNRAMLVLKRGWEEMGTLFGVIIAPSGTMKTPAEKHAQWPLYQLQKAESINHEGRMALWEEDHARWEQEKKTHRGPEPPKPMMRDYFTTDINMEAVSMSLKATPGLCYVGDEIASWVERMNQYRKGGDRQQWMSIHSGQPIKVNRLSRSVFIERPVVGVFGSIQPEIVGTLVGEIGAKDGLVYRYLPAIPKTVAATFETDEVSTEAYAGIAGLFRSIDALPLVASGEDPLQIRLSPAARSAFGRWYNDNSTESQRIGGAHRGFYVKLASHVARFILILHVADDPARCADPVPPDTVHRAIRIGEFFRQEMHRFIPLLNIGGDLGSCRVGLWSRVRKYLVELTNSGTDEPLNDGWVRQRDLLMALGNVRKEELFIELNTHIDLREVEKRETELRNAIRVEYRLSDVQRFNGSSVQQFQERAPWE